jgi:hypothetical protein
MPLHKQCKNFKALKNKNDNLPQVKEHKSMPFLYKKQSNRITKFEQTDKLSKQDLVIFKNNENKNSIVIFPLSRLIKTTSLINKRDKTTKTKGNTFKGQIRIQTTHHTRTEQQYRSR